MRFEKLNINPKGIRAGDCVIRATAYAMNKEWDEVYSSLCIIGSSMKRMPNEKQVYEKYLEKQGWTKHKQPKDMYGKKFTVSKFLNQCWHKETGKIIISLAGHLTCAEPISVYTHNDDFKLVDTWDCSSKCVGNYWTKNN